MTSVGRDHQVIDALPLQCLTLWHWREHVRIFFVGYSADTKLAEFIWDNRWEMLDAGYLQYARCSARSSWHARICKNGIHYWASEWVDLLVNMDGDRIIGSDMLVHIFEHLNIHTAGQQLVGHYSSTADSGTYGTIACPTRCSITCKATVRNFSRAATRMQSCCSEQ